MIPGVTSKVSEEVIASTTTIYPKSDLVRLTGTTAVSTIIPSFGGGFGGFLIVVPTDGSVALNTAGNILKAVTLVQNQMCTLVYSKRAGAWYPGPIS